MAAKKPTSKSNAAPKQQAALDAFAAKHLGGRAMPDELRVLLSRALAHEGSLDAYDFSFGLEPSDVAILAKVTSAEGGATWAALFNEIAWFGRTQFGSFGYFHGGADRLDDAPVVLFTFGKPEVIAAGPTLIDALLSIDGDDDDVRESLASECEAAGLPAPLSAEDRDAAMAKRRSVDDRLAELEKEHAAVKKPRPLQGAGRR